ncbi:MAG: hypothetical protein K2Q33_07805, partial [Gammaproteobacteria bacterium]|nr:hypothetical protein [Gammaproteobacteria bacterium]
PNSSRRELGFRRDNTAYVYFLKDKGYENKPALYDLQTPLLVACLHRDEPMIEVLLNYGADPKQLSADGFDALGYYCYYMPNMAEHPLYASIKKQYQFYDTLSSSIPVHRQAAQKDTAEKLIARGCDVNAYQGKGKNKATPLSLAIQNGGGDETNLLLRLKAKFSLVDNAIIEEAKRTKARSLNSQNSGSQFFPACAQNAQDIPEGTLNRPINH